MKIKITTLIENNIDNEKKLVNEHGLSLYIEADNKNILFDTGKSGDFIKNANSLNKNLEYIDYVIISHGHYDHSGGFQSFMDRFNKRVEVFVGAEFFKPKYKLLDDKTFKYIGNQFDENYILEKHIPFKKIEGNLYYITDNIILFHHFARKTGFETISDEFFVLNDNVMIHDKFDDEIVLGITMAKGLVVVVGCSHVGIVNILNTIIEKTGMPIYAVIGGTHLVKANEIRMRKTIEELHKLNLGFIGVSHCTGEEGIKLIKEEFGDRFIYNNTGNVIEIDL